MRFSFRLKPGRDDDLIAWLSNLGEGERSVFVRQALRHALERIVTQEEYLIEPSQGVIFALPEAEPAQEGNVQDIEAKLDQLTKKF